jgi:hypothetical protein
MHQILEILEESTDSAGPDLIALDDLKLALGIIGTTEDAALQASITSVSRMIAEYCNRRFGMAQVIETFTFDPYENLRAREALVLSLYPVAEISEVSSVGATSADYQLDPASGRLWLTNPNGDYGYWSERPYRLWPWPGTVSVAYSGGFDLPEQAPARLQQAVIQTIKSGRIYATRDPAIRGVQHGDTRIDYYTPQMAYGSNDFLGPVLDLISPYKSLYIA